MGELKRNSQLNNLYFGFQKHSTICHISVLKILEYIQENALVIDRFQ